MKRTNVAGMESRKESVLPKVGGGEAAVSHLDTFKRNKINRGIRLQYGSIALTVELIR